MLLHVVDQLLEAATAPDVQAALSFIGIGADDLHAMGVGVLLDRLGLVFGRVSLVVGGHAHVLRGADQGRRLARWFRVDVVRIHHLVDSSTACSPRLIANTLVASPQDAILAPEQF